MNHAGRYRVVLELILTDTATVQLFKRRLSKFATDRREEIIEKAMTVERIPEEVEDGKTQFQRAVERLQGEAEAFRSEVE